MNSVIFVGAAERFTVTEGPISVAFVVGGPGFATSVPLLTEATSRILRHYIELFAGGPPSARLLVVINPDSSVVGGGGGVFRRSISMTFQAPPSKEGIGGWGHTLAHELFHIWNATALQRADESVEWYLEGWADYYSVLAMTRLGYFPGSMWAFKAGNWLAEYDRVAGRISLIQAGIQEWEPPGPQMLYNGGAIAALALDVAIRRASPGGNGLDDALQALYARYGNTGVGVTNDALEAAVRQAGFDASQFFQSHVAGTIPIATQPLVDYFGLERNGRLTRLTAAPGAAQVAARARYFGQHADLTVSAPAPPAPSGGIGLFEFDAAFTGTPTRFQLRVKEQGESLSASLESATATLQALRVERAERLVTADFDTHGEVLRLSLRLAESGRFTGTWLRGGASGPIAGTWRVLHN